MTERYYTEPKEEDHLHTCVNQFTLSIQSECQSIRQLWYNHKLPCERIVDELRVIDQLLANLLDAIEEEVQG